MNGNMDEEASRKLGLGAFGPCLKRNDLFSEKKKLLVEILTQRTSILLRPYCTSTQEDPATTANGKA